MSGRKYSKHDVKFILIYFSKLEIAITTLRNLENRSLDLPVHINDMNMSFLRSTIIIGDRNYQTLNEYGLGDIKEVKEYVEIRNRLVRKEGLVYELLSE